jgi:hypothetical protein
MAAADNTNATELHTVIQLVESVVAMALPKFAEAAMGLLISRLTSGPDIEDTNRPFFVFAVILLALLNKPFRISASQITLLVNWITLEESFSRSRQIELWEWDSAGKEWLVGLGCDGPEKWVKLAQRLSDSFPVFEPLVSRMTLS